MLLTYGLLQVLPWNIDTTIEKMGGCNWCCQMTSFNIYMPETKELSLLLTMISPCCNSCSAKTSKSECVAAFALLFCSLSNGWLQLKLRINSILLKKRWLQVLVSKKHSSLENTRSLQKASWNNDSTTHMAGSAPLK